MSDTRISSYHRTAGITKEPAPDPGFAGRCVAVLIFAVVGWFSLSMLDPPGPEEAAPDGFLLERALADVAALAREPRPTGSAAHERARQYLLAEIRAAGLQARVQEAVVPAGSPPDVHRLTRVRNVMARLPGKGEEDAILLASHYDSVPAAPGAGDAAAGVAALLETMRVMAGGEAPDRDVIFLFTDAEELGLLGARAFVDAGLADDVGWVLNFEGRGAAGASLMFETMPGDLNAMRFFAETSPRPAASSYSYDVYRRMPNDTDFSVFREAVPAGFNFAFIEDPSAYHSSVDTPERLARDSLLHHGIQAVSLARALAESPPKAGGERAVYFSVPGHGLVVYPAAWDSYVTVAVSALGLVVIGIGFHRRRLRPVRLLVAAVAVVACMAASIAVLLALRWLWMDGFGLARDTRGVLAPLGYSWLIVAAAVAWLSATWMARRVGIVHLAVAAAAWWTALAVLSAWLLASSAFLFTWPVLFVWLALPLMVTSGEGRLRWSGPVVLGCALPAIVIWVPTLKGLSVALGPAAVVLGVAASLPVLLLSLQAAWLTGAGRNRWWLPATVLAAGLGAFGWAAMEAGPARSHPRADSLVYALEAGSREAIWASYDASVDEWTGRVLGEDPRRGVLPGFLDDDLEVLTAPAEALALPGPEITLVSSERLEGGERRVTLDLRSVRGAPVMEISVSAADGLRRVRVDDESLEVNGNLRLTYHAVPRNGIRVVLDVAGDGPMEVAVVDGSFGLPAIAPARPPELQPRREPWTLRDRKFPVSDVTLVRSHRTIWE